MDWKDSILPPSVFTWVLFAPSSYNVSLRQGVDGVMSPSVSESWGIVAGKNTYLQGTLILCFCFFHHSYYFFWKGGV